MVVNEFYSGVAWKSKKIACKFKSKIDNNLKRVKEAIKLICLYIDNKI